MMYPQSLPRIKLLRIWKCLAVGIVVVGCLASTNPAISEDTNTVADYKKLPANQWVLIHREDGSGGKMFAKAVWAENVKRLYLWGTGGEKPARNVYLRYELESFDPNQPAWLPAFPEPMANKWSAKTFPPFRIYGQSGPDGLGFAEGPRLQVVGGYHSTNRIRWWDFDGVLRPSPIHTFNMACWDSRRHRALYYSDGFTFALDPISNTWTDLKARNHPTTCRSVAWASMCYDPINDQALLFGGGLATNPSGAAPTWLYDCKANSWRPLDQPGVVPPPRCNTPIVFEPVTGKMFMFGGYDQSAALADFWSFDCENGRWSEVDTQRRPPPMYAPATVVLPGGKILVCGNDARKVQLHHPSTSSAVHETWIYDAADDQWQSVGADLELPGYRWLTAADWPEKGAALLVAFGPERRTYAFRYDEMAKHGELPGANGSVAWKYPEQKRSLETADPPEPETQARILARLPANTFVDASPPGMLISKTWSTAVMDTDRSEVLYTGGGHSGYSGNDFARYSLVANRWSLDQPPRFPPFLEGTNAGIFGWSYGMMPFSQHTYLWYCYDPASKTVVYLARPSIPDGTEVQLGDDLEDVFIYDSKKHGYASWVYDPTEKKMRKPAFGRPFANPWHLSLVGTPLGVFAMCEGRLYQGNVRRESGHVDWKLADSEFPVPREEIKYHYEFQPLLHDSTRNRLIQLKGDSNRVDVFARSLSEGAKWRQLTTTGAGAIGREAVYIPKHDTILWLGDKLYALDCATNRMGELEIELPAGQFGHECAMVYDPRHDVCMALIPRSFTGPMQTFLFRFDPTTAKYR